MSKYLLEDERVKEVTKNRARALNNGSAKTITVRNSTEEPDTEYEVIGVAKRLIDEECCLSPSTVLVILRSKEDGELLHISFPYVCSCICEIDGTKEFMFNMDVPGVVTSIEELFNK